MDITHPRGQALYEDWGFKEVAEQQLFPDSPAFVVVLAELPLKWAQTKKTPRTSARAIACVPLSGLTRPWAGR
ncbi:hypothetical protein [Streptomyces sp. NPDC057623]|uniref:hypothetical protein n=1 Tax=Streptomyces sp. NPDC057623 TaxID=3346187 RepID=UPI0036ADB9D3